MKRTLRVMVGLVMLGILADLVLHVIVIGTVKPTPLTVYVYDADSNQPLSGIVIYYALSYGTEPHILGVPTFQTTPPKKYRQRAYSDVEGRATFSPPIIPLHVWESIDGEFMRVNFDTMNMPSLEYGFGPDAEYRPNSDYEGRLLVTPRLLPKSTRKRFPGTGWDLAVIETGASGGDVVPVALHRYGSAAPGLTTGFSDVQIQDSGGAGAR